MPTAEQMGWDALMDGNMIEAVYTMFDISFGSMGIVVVILFMVYQVMLYSKTQNLALMFFTGALFTGLYVTSQYVEPFSVKIIAFILVLELAGIFYMALTMGKR